MSSAAEVLAAHQGPVMVRLSSAECFCGAQFHGTSGKAEQWADHALDALKAAGFAVARIPWADSDSPLSWLDASVTATRKTGKVRIHLEDHRLTATDARDIAGALLAAAEATT